MVLPLYFSKSEKIRLFVSRYNVFGGRRRWYPFGLTELSLVSRNVNCFSPNVGVRDLG